MIVEPAAGDHVEDNLNPVGALLRLLHAAVHAELALPGRRPRPGHPGRTGRIRDVVTTAGFTRFRLRRRRRSTTSRGPALTGPVDGQEPGRSTGRRSPVGPVLPTGRASSCATACGSPGRSTADGPTTVLSCRAGRWSRPASGRRSCPPVPLLPRRELRRARQRASDRPGRGGRVRRRTSTPSTSWPCWTPPPASGPSSSRSPAAWSGRSTSRRGTPSRVLGCSRCRRPASTCRTRRDAYPWPARLPEDRGLGEAQPARLARGGHDDFLQFFFERDVLRAALDQAGRGRRRVGAEVARRPSSTAWRARSGCDGAVATPLEPLCRQGAVPGDGAARHRGPGPAVPGRRAAGRAHGRLAARGRGRRPRPPRPASRCS